MSQVMFGVALVHLLTIAGGTLIITRMARASDALLVVLLMGTTGVALAAVLAGVMNMPSALDVALVLALLAAVLGVAFVFRGWPDPKQQQRSGHDLD